MPIDPSQHAAAEAAKKAAEAARKAAEAAKKAAAAAAAAAAKPAPKAASTKPPAKVFGDEMSAGRTLALKARAALALGGPSPISVAPLMATEGVKATAVSATRPSPEWNAAVKAYSDLKVDPKNPTLKAPYIQGMLYSHRDQPDYLAGMVAMMAADYTLGRQLSYLWNLEGFDKSVALTTIDSARKAGALDDSYVAKLAGGYSDNPKLTARETQAWKEIAAQLDPPIAPLDKAGAAAAADKLHELKGTLDEKHGEVAKLDEKLKLELEMLGPAATETQKQELIQKFREKHSKVYGEEDEAAKQLGTFLSDPVQRSLLEQAIANGDKTQIEAIYGDLQVAAKYPGSGEAVALFVKQLASAPNGTAWGRMASFIPGFEEKVQNEVLGPALQSAVGRYLVEEQPTRASEKARDLLEQFDGLSKLPKASADIKKSIETLDKLAKGTWTAGEVKDLLAPFAKGNAFERSLGAVVVAANLWALHDDVRAGEFESAAKSALMATDGGLKLLSNTMGIFAAASRFAGPAEAIAGFSARLSPIAGFLVSAITAHQDFEKLREDPSVGKVITFVGDIISCAGSVLGPYGAPITVVGGLVSGSGMVVDYIRGEIEKQAELEELLGKPTVQAIQLASEWLQDNDFHVQRAGQLSLTHEQLQSIAKNYPSLLTAHGTGGDGIFLAALSAGAGGYQVEDFIDKLVAEKGGDLRTVQQELNDFRDSLRARGLDLETQKKEMRAWLVQNYPNAMALVPGADT